jgi:Ca-activated chloride channel family protein
VEYVGLQDDGSAAARRFHERVHNPLLTDISIDWGGLPVTDIYPERTPDLFGAKPVVISGRYTRAAAGAIRLRGKLAGKDFVRTIKLDLPASQPANDALATLWARRRVEHLMSQDLRGMQQNNPRAEIKAQVTQLGLDYRIMTQFTSFVAVEETVVTEGGQPRRVEVPVEMPEGLQYEGVFGDSARPMAMAKSMSMGGAVGGVVGGVFARREMAMAPPPPLPPPQAAPQQTRIDPAIGAWIQRVKSGGRPSVDEARFVFGGKAMVRLALADTAPATMESLRKLGFEVIRGGGGMVTGRIAVDKLEALSQLAVVTRIEPAN